MKKCFRILAIVGLFSFAQSAHSGKTQEQIKIGKKVSQIPRKMLLFKEIAPAEFPRELEDLIAKELNFVTTTYETHTGAQFRYVAPGEYADASLGEGRMDERGFVWYAPPAKIGHIFLRSMPGALQECESYTLENRSPERLVHVPKLERFIDLAADLGFGKKGGYQPLGFFSFLLSYQYGWTSTFPAPGEASLFDGVKGHERLTNGLTTFPFAFLCGVEAGEITIRRGEYFDFGDIY